ncbi:PEP-CTERM sorting domain-containing protein [Lacipirellula parvula]|uniref:PEP-CTERM protein-sorting domain-containing protein n=1 Tax=Lacipirellula parvula TaxID=2650471 RepID=A0A5K7XAN0_9BACT|nr:PEP-CTERM sorting domain-containing protein [Lacipirellula parvula]BBO33598.1 hypothetical protein PLANPX_3210 [Lacipirellula parvula]
MSVEHASSSAAALSRRAGYALAATVAATGSATDADGAVVYSGIQNISISQFNYQTLKIDGDNNVDIVLKNYVFTQGNYQGGTVSFAPGAVAGFAANGLNYASALNAGVTIDQSSLGGFAFSMAYGAKNPSAQFNNAVNKYLGFAFPIGSELHYSWIRVSVNQAAGTFVIHDWAWENQADVPIMTGAGGLGDFNVDGVVNGADFLVWQRSFGDTYDAADLEDWKSAFGNGVAAATTVAAVPEPGALGLLAAGAGGLEILRRRHGRRKSS